MMRKIRGRAAGPRPAAAARDPRFLAEAATAAPVRFHIATHAAGAMDFFEGKRVRELRNTFEDALDASLEPQSMQVRVSRDARRPRARREKKNSANRGGRNPPRPAAPHGPHLTSRPPHATRESSQEFSAALSGVDAEMHEPLYDLYCQLLQGISTFSLDEFESILKEEALVPRLNAVDQACEARGIMGFGASAANGSVAPLTRPPDAVMRALRADLKRKEADKLRAKMVEAEAAAAAAKKNLHEKSAAAKKMANDLRTGAAELRGVNESVQEWVNRTPTFPAGSGMAPATAGGPAAA